MALATLAAALAGCASLPVEKAPLDPAARAADFTARSLDDPALHRFLAENLGRDPGAAWDFEALSWAAFYFHPSLAVARAQWAVSRAAQQTAAARPNPTLSLTPGYDTTRTPGLSPWMPAVNLDFLLPNTAARARQVDAARADAEAARLGVFTAVWQIRSELRRALTDAAISARRAEQLHAQTSLQQKLLTLLDQRAELGSASRAEVSVARSALLRAEASAADAASQSAIARAHVAAALGLPLAALDRIALPVPPAPPPLSAEALAAARRQSLQSRADVLAALARYDSAQSALALQVAKRAPDFHLGPGYQWDQGDNKWTLALSFEVPLFNRNEGPIAEAAARRAQAAAEFTAVQAQVVAAIDAAVAAQSAAAAQLEHARALRTELEQQTARTRQRLALGAADQAEVETAQLDAATADGLLLDAENAAAVAAGQLEDALQVPFANLSALADPARVSSRTP